MNMRKITSLTALTSFVLLLLTSIILYIVPAGRVAYWAGYRLWGLSKEDWAAVHINLGVLLLIAVILHVYYNWAAMISYMKNRTRQLRVFTPDFNVALMLTLAVFFGTLAGIPPMSSIIHLGEAVTDRANIKYGEPPYGHAELSPLSDFVDKVQLDLDQSLATLQAAGIVVASPRQTMQEIAEANGTPPQKIYDMIRPAVETGGQMPEEAPGGTGKRTLVQLCELYQLDVDRVRAGLRDSGVTAAADQSMKDIAAAHGMDPQGLYGLIYRISRQ